MSRLYGQVVTFACGGVRPLLGMMESPRKGVTMTTDNRASEHDSTTNPALAV
ncbi:ABC transporter ATP-binding protein, partial [Bifidobacterium animalis subsp. lactis]|nr:ABC transporter ATP-binding protein [Bifidobacterium animalis subsp. lactis]